VALVGQSGCGKSTIIQLIQRFYNLEAGSLELEGHNVESLNVPYLRSKIGIVSQVGWSREWLFLLTRNS
jgi:ATP-binding cassette subfamily B (MDR/TAP) protein 1